MKFIKLCQDIEADLRADEGYWRKFDNKIRIYTRNSRNPMLNWNGGDYDFWTDYSIENGVVVAVTDWSAEFDPIQWNVYSKTEYCCMSWLHLEQIVEHIYHKLVLEYLL